MVFFITLFINDFLSFSFSIWRVHRSILKFLKKCYFIQNWCVEHDETSSTGTPKRLQIARHCKLYKFNMCNDGTRDYLDIWESLVILFSYMSNLDRLMFLNSPSGEKVHAQSPSHEKIFILLFLYSYFFSN